MKIGLIYISTGRYIEFFPDFFASAERHLLNGHALHYFVFTDRTLDLFNQCERIHVIPQSQLNWPLAVLSKFRIILGATLDLQEMDFLFMVNANVMFKVDVGEEIIPEEDTNWLIGVQHPYFYDKTRNEFPYERSPESTACIAMEDGSVYYAAGFAGGRTGEWLRLCTTLHRNTEIDYSKGIIAIWHDESHLNRYFLENPPRTLTPAYIYPEGEEYPFEQKIVVFDKTKRGGYGNFRRYEWAQKNAPVSAFRRLLGKVNSVIAP